MSNFAARGRVAETVTRFGWYAHQRRRSSRWSFDDTAVTPLDNGAFPVPRKTRRRPRRALAQVSHSGTRHVGGHDEAPPPGEHLSHSASVRWIYWTQIDARDGPRAPRPPFAADHDEHVAANHDRVFTLAKPGIRVGAGSLGRRSVWPMAA